MTDNELIQLFLPLIRDGLVADGYTTVVVKQFNQPTQQGLNTVPTVYFSKIPGDRRYGWVTRLDQWDGIKMNSINKQWYESTFTITALTIQDPTNISFTANDLADEVSDILQATDTIAALSAAGVGILRITAIQNPYSKEDRGQFEAFASFDFTLTHQKTRITPIGVVESVEIGLFPV